MKLLRVLLQCVGGLAIVVLVVVAVYAFLSFSGPRKNTSKDDAVFVLNWAGLNPTQNWSVIDGSISARNITGDHADYYCIQLQDISIAEPDRAGWRNGPETNDLLAEALEQSIGWARNEGASCFPSVELANSDQMRILFWNVVIHGRFPTGAQVLLLYPATKQLFYVSFAS